MYEKGTGLAGLLVLLLLCAAPCIGGAEVEDGSGFPGTVEVGEAPPYERHWYLAIGGSNYHPRLRYSEAKIDRQLNDLFGWLPFWEEPTTLRDWRNRFMLWDMCFGVGRDITPRTSWMVWTGGVAGAIKNRERYGPLSTDIRFSRTTAFLTLEGYFYPWDKVDYASQTDTRGMERVRTAVANVKPFVALATGYTFIRSEADAKFKFPLIGTFFQQGKKFDHHMFQISPRIGFEVPLSPRNSLAAEGTYYFFTRRPREYNGPSMSITFRRRF